MTKLNFKLVRPAKGKGGDRYEAYAEGEDRPVVIYVPQNISRAEGKPVPAMEVVFNPI